MYDVAVVGDNLDDTFSSGVDGAGIVECTDGRGFCVTAIP